LVKIISLLALVNASPGKELQYWIGGTVAPQSCAAEQVGVPLGNRTQNPRTCSPKQTQLTGSFHYDVVRDMCVGGGVTVVRK